MLTATGGTVYLSTPEAPPARVGALLGWYRQELAHPTLHPVARAARLHHRFTCIRPFDAGNGAVAALLLNLALRRSGYGLVVLKAADHVRYHAALAAADAGEPEPLLHLVAEHAAASLRRLVRAARGETHDEPDELAAKVALLKQRVLSREDTVRTLWCEEQQQATFEVLVQPWLGGVNSHAARARLPRGE